jgi:monoamine oxidase
MKMYRVAGGNSRLPEALADSLKRRPQLATRVIRVEGTSAARHGRVRAIVESNDRRASFSCDAVIVAVPATLARKIEFSPRLPPQQQTAIDTLPYGRATKALVSFDRRFWRRRGHAFATRLPTGAAWEAGAKGNGGTLAFLAGGDASRSLADLVAAGTAADWRRALQWLGVGEARVLDATAVTWEKDPYALGAYAHQSPAYDPALLPWLATPAGRIAFAGEHTSGEHQGYMEGAVASGLRAADDILWSLVLAL